MFRGVLFASALFFLAHATAERKELNADECLKRGFDKTHVQCGHCDLLDDHVSAQTTDGAMLRWECRQCCEGSATEGGGAFASAVLEVDERWVHGSTVGHFIEKHLDDFKPALKLRHRNGVMPRLQMLDGDGKIADTVNVHGWEAGLITEYLRAKLR